MQFQSNLKTQILKNKYENKKQQTISNGIWKGYIIINKKGHNKKGN